MEDTKHSGNARAENESQLTGSNSTPCVECESLSRELRQRVEREQALASGIAGAAIKAGIIDSPQPLTGPQLLLLCDDLANSSKSRAECLMADCKEAQEHFCFKHCIEVFVPPDLAGQVFAKLEETP